MTLSFDNGPHAAVTPTVLKCLERHGAKTTFFLIGDRVLAPGGLDLAKAARSHGHWLGNHTFSHRTPLGLLPAEEALSEFDRAHAAIEQTGETRRLFRPYGGGGRQGKHLMQVPVVTNCPAFTPPQ